MLCSFAVYFQILPLCTTKNLATLVLASVGSDREKRLLFWIICHEQKSGPHSTERSPNLFFDFFQVAAKGKKSGPPNFGSGLPDFS
jgi:hypothetical protein